MFSSWQEERPRKLFSGAAASSRRQRGDHRRAGLQRQRGAGPRPGAVRVHSSFIRTCWTSEERSEPIYDQSLLLLLWFLWGSSSISGFTVRTGPIQLHKARGSIHWIAMTSLLSLVANQSLMMGAPPLSACPAKRSLRPFDIARGNLTLGDCEVR